MSVTNAQLFEVAAKISTALEEADRDVYVHLQSGQIFISSSEYGDKLLVWEN